MGAALPALVTIALFVGDPIDVYRGVFLLVAYLRRRR